MKLALRSRMSRRAVDFRGTRPRTVTYPVVKQSFNFLECLVLRLGREEVEDGYEDDIADDG